MKNSKQEILNVLFEKYSIKILQLLNDKAMRFNELQLHIKNARTLSLKLIKLQENGLVEAAPVKVEGKYVNSYKITKRGSNAIKTIEKIV